MTALGRLRKRRRARSRSRRRGGFVELRFPPPSPPPASGPDLRETQHFARDLTAMAALEAHSWRAESSGSWL